MFNERCNFDTPHHQLIVLEEHNEKTALDQSSTVETTSSNLHVVKTINIQNTWRNDMIGEEKEKGDKKRTFHKVSFKESQ